MSEGSLAVKPATVWRWEESEKRRKKKEDQGRERVRRKKMQIRKKVDSRQVAKRCVFPIFCGSEK